MRSPESATATWFLTGWLHSAPRTPPVRAGEAFADAVGWAQNEGETAR